MSKIPLSELDELFQQAIALPATDRAEFIERNCGSRPAVHTEIRRMLDAHANAGEFLDGSLQSYLCSAQSGGQIGRWKLIEPIGEGGLGVVYRASCEADGVTLHAAVKILRAGFHKGVFQERFIQERSLLSGLDHPYIARLIDAGADCGDSFLAVEFVNGVSLDRYLEESNVSVRDRLNIFVRICEAVEYLHSNRIVHGDIKPANVMVKEDTTPKLLDFGTARLIDAGDCEAARFSRLIMTPGYASPEQAAGLGPSVRGDVYSLGCVLRDMLAHVPPRTDLTAIRDKCLSVSPQDRYASARDIAADVQRYLKHYPVRAMAASGRYVTAKFVRRNWAACALASVAVLSLLTGSVLSLYDARRADLYASRHKSVIAHLVTDQAVAAATPESNQRAALTGSIQDVIGQLQAMNPQPAAELAGAWRRLSYIEASRGQTQQSVESIQRSIEYARRNRAGNDSTAARADLAESLLYAAFLQNQRGYVAKAGGYGAEAIELIDLLPEQERAGLEQTPHFLFALFSVAQRMAQSGDIQGGRELLLRGLDTSRTMGKSLQLRLLLDLAGFEKRARNTAQVEHYCQEAKSLDIVNPRFRKLCEEKVRPADLDRRASELVQKSSVIERRVVYDPESLVDRRQLARLKLQLARTVAASGDTARADRLVEEARAFAQPLIEADPENRRMQLLSRSLNRGARLRK